ncbi:CRISPR-associated helicase Cas3' [Actinomadura kijaniata]|nr:CRISPR-associated helicase Cas3' [Actinomadura namibiensis]
MLSVDARLWGKHAGLPAPYPAVCHLVDTAAVAGALWDAWVDGLPALQSGPFSKISREEARSLICFWAGLHDLGKVSPSFQALVEELYEDLVAAAPEYGLDDPVQGLRHNEVSQWILAQLFQELGYPGGPSARRHVGHQIAQMLGGHHGAFCPALAARDLRDPRGARDGIGQGVWEEQSRSHALALQKLTGAWEPLQERLPVALAVAVTGLVIIADWLASQESFITARIPAPDWVASEEALLAHWQRAVADAPEVVRQAGLGRAVFRDSSFEELFPFKPNPLQASVANELPAMVGGPGLLLVTAPPGDGKTEVALFGTTVLGRACGTGGLGFCLPTMATTDAMHSRVKEFCERALLEDAALTRVHSMAWLSTDTATDNAADAAGAEAVVTEQPASVEATRWLHASRRGLIAPLSTFTVDQGLTGVLPVKYGILRLLALSGKVVVVDEAHSYDAWMHQLLVRLLEWLGALGAPVVLLSATLTGASARALVEAYLRGAGHHALTEPVATRYPGWLFADAATGQVSAPRQVRSERERALRFQIRPVTRGDDVDRSDHRLQVIKTLLDPVVRDDRGCVLICCTTVLEAQETYEHLARWFASLRESGSEPPELRLLHSRFRAADRAAITDACEKDFGKRGQRPHAVLVATQIVEQSLDLDFDLLITDLAPMALLLQRAGRCQRHRGQDQDPHQGRRPRWIEADPLMVVLDPVDRSGEFVVPKEWGTVYDESLLRRTSRLLQEQGTAAVQVPGDVQRLVDAVYDAEFASVRALDDTAASALQAADGQRLAEQAAQRQLAEIVGIDPPYERRLHDLWRLSNTSVPVDEAMIATRLGADSARLVCLYEQAPDRWTLDEEGQLPVPGLHGKTRVTAPQARLIAQHVIPVPGSWLSDDADLLDAPQSWQDNSVLRGWALLAMRRAPEGGWAGRIRTGPVQYHPKTGLAQLQLPRFGS